MSASTVLPAVSQSQNRPSSLAASLFRRVTDVNRELWLLLTLFVLAAAANWLTDAGRIILGFYALPTIFSAYYYGRRHAVLTGLGSMLLIVLVAFSNPVLMNSEIRASRWLELGAWGATLMIMAYAMGTLYEHNQNKIRELRETYHGLLMILQQFIAKDKYTQNHSYRVSVYAAKIASYMGLSPERVEDVRSAALLHDIGKLDVSRQVLYKAARLTEEEFEEMKAHVERGISILEPVGGTLRRILPIILAHHDKFDGSGYHPTQGEAIPLEARIISVADVYDSLASDRPYRKAMSPFEAREIIEKGAGKDFDPRVVEAFLKAFQRREMEVPDVVI
jgi:putative nucleotidyltransferase with HDIG domain